MPPPVLICHQADQNSLLAAAHSSTPVTDAGVWVNHAVWEDPAVDVRIHKIQRASDGDVTTQLTQEY
jgi:hypothetical protein